MRWIRSHRRLGSRLALFALAVQLVLSFGHIHLDKIISPAATGVAQLQTASRDQAPVAPGHHGGAADFCAICATIALVASSVLPEAAQLAPPISVASTRLAEFFAARPVFDLHTSFQARAPPVVG
jgi:hypothetical protein